MATTLHRLSGGRYAFGLGRGFDLLWDVMGLPRITGAQMEDAIGIYRSLWHGTAVVAHDGPAGSYPYLSQDSTTPSATRPASSRLLGPMAIISTGMSSSKELSWER